MFLSFAKKSKFLLVLFCAFLVASCGGGGGGGGPSSAAITASPVWNSSITVSEANTYRTAEYNSQWGLEAIKAAQAYALLAKNGKEVAGGGVKIGIIDTGVQINHREIATNYSATGSYDYINSDSNPSDDNGHGTHVASTAAGVKDGLGMHGVAFNATILAEKNLDSLGDGTGNIVALGISGASAAGAKVLNMSFGGTGLSTNEYNALVSAKGSDVLSVAANGNDGSSVTQPQSPALNSGDSVFQGYILAVGSISQSLTQSSFSNMCGSAMNYCLYAPGENIYAAYPINLYALADGTSMATPHVAGAAAVIRSAWPHLSAPQTAQILLTTATDLGAAGVDSIYGHGLLNLYAAVQAQGQNTLGYGSLVAQGGYDLKNSTLNLDPIFGDSFSKNVASQLENAVFFDDYGRDYKAFLGNKISAPKNSSLSSSSLLLNNITNKTIPLFFGFNSRFAAFSQDSSANKSLLKFNIANFKNPEAQNFLGIKFATIDHSQNLDLSSRNGFSFTQNISAISSNLEFGLAFNFDEISAREAKNFDDGNFLRISTFGANPYQSFLRNGSSNLSSASFSTNAFNYLGQQSRKFNQLFISQKFFDQKFNLKFSYQSSYDIKQQNSSQSLQMLGKSNNLQNQILDFGFSLQAKKNTNFDFSFGALSEFNNNILNSKSLGAFESPNNVRTSYAKFSFNHKLLKNINFSFSMSEGISQISGNEKGLFRNFSDLRSRSSALALTYDNFLNGKIGLAYIEPMRIYSGKVSFDIPIARDNSGNIIRQSGVASLAPKGKERDLEFFYSKNLSDFSYIKLNFLMQKQAGNLQSTGNNYLGIVSYGSSF